MSRRTVYLLCVSLALIVYFTSDCFTSANVINGECLYLTCTTIDIGPSTHM